VKGVAVAVDAGAAALLVDGRLEDFLFDVPPGGPPDAPAPETILRGRVDRVAPQIGAAFLRLPGGARGWLRDPGAKPGAWRVAQVARWADPGKAAPLTDRPVLKGRLALVTPGAPGANVARGVKGHAARARLEALAAAVAAPLPPDVGVVLRSAAAEADAAAVAAEVAQLAADWAAALATPGEDPAVLRPAPGPAARAARDWPAPDAWDDRPDAFERLGVWDALQALRSPVVDLPRGAWMTVEATGAGVMVDVNTGEDFAKGAAQAANEAACAELPRQLRLRGLGGLVYLDLAPIRKGARQGVDNALRRAFADDPVETQAVGWTPAGAVELQRKRERRPLRDWPHG